MPRTHRPQPQSSRHAFTLVELLVVIAIIGTLVGMLLPAVQAAREAARRSQCGNNLKQLALGVLNHESARRALPSGWVYTDTRTNAESWAWGALLLPMIEEAPLHAQLRVTEGNLAANLLSARWQPVTTGVQTVLGTFRCPSDVGAEGGVIHNDRRFNGGIGHAARPYTPGVSNYIGVAGHYVVTDADRANSGLLYGNSRVRLAQISDGTSKTLLFGERDTRNCRSGAWAGIRNPQGTGSRGIWTAVGHARAKLNESALPWDNDPLGCGQGFSSLHPGGALFASAAGSVHFLTDDIEHRHITGITAQNHTDARNGVYQRLLSRDDGLSVDIP
ncbi:MAG: DUF1559 domain-containing protein [Planctomycetaceae bacterium]